MRKLWCLPVALVSIVTLTACGSSHHVAPPYAGRLYSVAQVQRAFASLGLQLHRDARRVPGHVFLLNNRRLGPQRIPSPPGAVTVVVATGRRAADKTLVAMPRSARVTRYANVRAISQPYNLDEVRAAVSALRWGTGPTKPGRRLIVLADSIGGIRLGESRRDVEKALGPGKSTRRGLVRYFGGHVLVSYWFHDGLYKHVEYLQTGWGGYRTRSGVHVGSTRQELRPLYVSCASKAECSLQAGPMPDAVGTIFTLRRGKVVTIGIGSF